MKMKLEDWDQKRRHVQAGQEGTPNPPWISCACCVFDLPLSRQERKPLESSVYAQSFSELAGPGSSRFVLNGSVIGSPSAFV